MSGFIEGENRYQSTLFTDRGDDYVVAYRLARREPRKNGTAVLLFLKTGGVIIS